MLIRFATEVAAVYLAFLVTFLFGHILWGSVIGKIFAGKIKVNEVIAFSTGLLSVFLIDSSFGRFIGGVAGINQALNLILFGILTLYLIYNLKSGEFYCIKKYFVSSLLISSLVIWIFLIPIFEDIRKQVIFGITSLGNNDLPGYSQLSMHNLTSGYHGDAQISPIVGTISVGNYLSKFTYIGTISLIDHFSKMLNLNVVQGTSLVLMIGVGFVFVVLKNLGISLGFSDKLATFLGFIGVLLPTSLYSMSMGFIGAEFGVAAFVVLTTCSLDYAANRIPRIEFLVVSTLGLSIALFTYSQIALPIFLGLLVIHCLSKLVLKEVQKIYRIILDYCIIVISGLLLSFDALPNLLTLTKWLLGKSFGWKLQVFDPISVFVSVSNISAIHDNYWLLLWVPFFAFVLVLTFSHMRVKNRIHESLLLMSLMLVPFIFAIKYGWDGYQTWKLITYIVPICVLIIFTLLSKNKTLIYFSLCFLLLQPVVLWRPIAAHTTQQITTQEAFEVSKIVNAKAITSINVNAGDFWQSMLVSSLLTTRHIALNAITYAPVSSISDTCTIVDKKNKLYNSELVSYKNSLYAIVNLPHFCS